eukprot:tig00020510_g9792.t1
MLGSEAGVPSRPALYSFGPGGRSERGSGEHGGWGDGGGGGQRKAGLGFGGDGEEGGSCKKRAREEEAVFVKNLPRNVEKGTVGGVLRQVKEVELRPEVRIPAGHSNQGRGSCYVEFLEDAREPAPPPPPRACPALPRLRAPGAGAQGGHAGRAADHERDGNDHGRLGG